MSRIYSVPFTGTITAAGGDTDVWSFQPGDDKPIQLVGFRLGQTTEVGDAQEEGVRVTIRRMTATVTVGTGGNAVTAATPPGDSLEPVWSFTARTNDTTVATTTGTNQITEECPWNNRNVPADFFYPDPKFYTKARQTELIVIRIETTLLDDMTFAGTAWIEED